MCYKNVPRKDRKRLNRKIRLCAKMTEKQPILLLLLTLVWWCSASERSTEDLELIYDELLHIKALSHLSTMVKRELAGVLMFEAHWNAGKVCKCEYASLTKPVGLSQHTVRAGLSSVPVVPWEGPPSHGGSPPISCQFLLRCFDVWTFSVRLNVTTKKGRQLFWEKKCTATDKKIMASRTRKGPPPYVGMEPPEWLIRPCTQYPIR